jgi:pimeloyl-ACP methyl ester carboxylesterase
MPGARLDYLLTRLSARLAKPMTNISGHYIEITAGRLYVSDSARDNTAARNLPCIVFTPDGPNSVGHYTALIALLAGRFRIVCFDMPGFGLSLPAANYHHTLEQGAHAVLELLTNLNIECATLAFSCANGLYAIRAAQLAPSRIASLVLTQTPSLLAMQTWAYRMIPLPLRLPAVGQLIAWLVRRKLARRWYRSALPLTTDAAPWQQLSDQLFDAGGCFCLPGVVQGLLQEDNHQISNIMTPATAIWGELDHSHQATPAQSLRICLPQAEFISFADCGHFPDLEQPVRYSQLLTAHMAKLQH